MTFFEKKIEIVEMKSDWELLNFFAINENQTFRHFVIPRERRERMGWGGERKRKIGKEVGDKQRERNVR